MSVEIFSRISFAMKERVHAGYTTFVVDNHSKSAKPRHTTSMDVNRYKEYRRLTKHETKIYQGNDWRTALECRGGTVHSP